MTRRAGSGCAPSGAPVETSRWSGWSRASTFGAAPVGVLVGSVLAVASFLGGVRLVGPGKASLLVTVEVPATILLAAVVLGQHLTAAQLAGWERAPAASLGTAWSEAANAMRMLERHFGRADRIAETPPARGVDAGVLERLQRFADRVTSARQELALEQAARSLKR